MTWIFFSALFHIFTIVGYEKYISHLSETRTLPLQPFHILFRLADGWEIFAKRGVCESSDTPDQFQFNP